MKNGLYFLRNYILIGFCTMFCLVSCRKSFENKQDNTKLLAGQLDSIFEKSKLTGGAVAIFSKDSLLFSHGFGYSNKAGKQDYNLETVQPIASVSKTLIGVSLIRAASAGKLRLDDPASQYLSFELSHPNFPDTEITLRQLAMHTGAIGSPEAYNDTYFFRDTLKVADWASPYHQLLQGFNKNSQQPFQEFLNSFFDPEGERYAPENFTANAPGMQYDYSNLGASLLALAIQNAEGKSFADLSSESILEACGMEHSYWAPRRFYQDPKASRLYSGNGNEFSPYGISSYPDGGLYSTVADLVKYGQELLRCARGEGKLMSAQDFRRMTEIPEELSQFPDALCWDRTFGPLIGHSGNDFGTNVLFYFNPEANTGQILFTNTSIDSEIQEESFYALFNALFAYDFLPEEVAKFSDQDR